MKLSVIIPVYNCENHLEYGFKKISGLYTLLSENDFEIIYVNDGSTDNSEAILKTIATQKNNIRIINQENKGLSGARNTGIQNAKGEYIQFLDADDYNNFEVIVELLKYSSRNTLDATSFAIRNVDEKGNDLGGKINHKLKFNKIMSGAEALISGYSPSSMCCFLFRRAFLLKEKLLFTLGLTHQDMEFSMRMLLVAKKVYFSDLVGYNYLQRLGSISNPKSKEKREKYLYDEVTISHLFQQNKKNEYTKELNNAITKNYNAIVWNLLWRFYKNPNEVDSDFKSKCINDLREKKLYPIKGPLKTNFQNLSRFLMNNSFLLNKFIIRK